MLVYLRLMKFVFIEIKEKRNPKNALIPSVLLELFFAYDPGDCRDTIANLLREKLKSTVLHGCRYVIATHKY